MDFNPEPIIAVVRAIIGIATPSVKYQLERSKSLIEIRKKWNLLPEYPRSNFDFTWVYQYAVVEFSDVKIKDYSDQAKPLIRLLEQREIIEAFYQSFYQKDESILIKEGDFFIESSALGDCIRELKFDIQKELSDFQAIFIETANSTRTPAEVIQAQKIEELTSKLETIILSNSSASRWSNYSNLYGLEGLVKFELEELLDSLGIVKPDNHNREKIYINQGFRLIYNIPFPGHVLLMQNVRSIWVITCLSNSTDMTIDRRNRHIQERIKFVPQESWSIPIDIEYMREDEDLGLHKFVLLLSQEPFPESIQNIVSEETAELSALSLDILLKYVKDNASNVKLIITECEIIC